MVSPNKNKKNIIEKVDERGLEILNHPAQSISLEQAVDRFDSAISGDIKFFKEFGIVLKLPVKLVLRRANKHIYR